MVCTPTRYRVISPPGYGSRNEIPYSRKALFSRCPSLRFFSSRVNVPSGWTCISPYFILILCDARWIWILFNFKLLFSNNFLHLTTLIVFARAYVCIYIYKNLRNWFWLILVPRDSISKLSIHLIISRNLFTASTSIPRRLAMFHFSFCRLANLSVLLEATNPINLELALATYRNVLYYVETFSHYHRSLLTSIL